MLTGKLNLSQPISIVVRSFELLDQECRIKIVWVFKRLRGVRDECQGEARRRPKRPQESLTPPRGERGAAHANNVRV